MWNADKSPASKFDDLRDAPGTSENVSLGVTRVTMETGSHFGPRSRVDSPTASNRSLGKAKTTTFAASSLAEPMSPRESNNSGSPGATKIRSQTTSGDTTQSDITKRVLEWDHQAAVTDQKQAELRHTQWALFREQMNTFSNEVITLRNDVRTLQMSESQLRQEQEAETFRRKELGAKVEDIIKADIRLTRSIEQVTDRFDGFEPRLVSHMQDVSHRLESDASMRSAVFERLEKHCTELRISQEKVSRDSAKLANDQVVASTSFHEELQSLADALSHEARERVTGDAEASRVATQAAEQATRERRSASEDMARQFADLNANLERERLDRISANEGVQAVVTGCKDDLASQRDERTLADGEMRRSLQSLDSHVSKRLEELKSNLTTESSERSTAHDRLTRMLTDMRASMETDTLRARIEVFESSRLEVSQELKVLSETLSRETRVRTTVFDEQSRSFEQLQEVLQREARERKVLDEDANRQLKSLSANLEQDRGDREQAESALKQQLTTIRVELTAEKEARGNDLVFREESKHDAEILRSGLERLQRDHLELSGQLGDEVAQRSKVLEETIRGRLLEFSQDLEELREFLNRETGDRLAGDERVSEELQELLGHHGGQRESMEVDLRTLHSGLEGRLNQLQELLGEHGGQKESMEVDLRTMHSGLEGRLEEMLAKLQTSLDAEREGRLEECAALSRAVQGIEGPLRRSSDDLRSDLDAEVAKRSACDERIKELRKSVYNDLDFEKKARVEACGELNRGLNALHQSLDEETSKQTRSLTRAEADFSEKLSSLQDGLDEKNTRRATGDDERARSVSELQVATERDIRELKKVDAAQAEQLLQLSEIRSMQKKETIRLEGLGTTLSDLVLEVQKEASQAVRMREAQAAFDGQLSELAASVRDEMGLQEAVHVATEATITTLKEALSFEADARGNADRELQRSLEACEANQGRERTERESEDRALRALISESGQGYHDVRSLHTSDVETLVADLRSDTNAETQRLWEAIDTHTHDVNVDEMMNTSRRSVQVDREVVRMTSPSPRPAAVAVSPMSPRMATSLSQPVFKQAAAVRQLALAVQTVPVEVQAVPVRRAYSQAAPPGLSQAASASVVTRQMSLSPRLRMERIAPQVEIESPCRVHMNHDCPTCHRVL